VTVSQRIDAAAPPARPRIVRRSAVVMAGRVIRGAVLLLLHAWRRVLSPALGALGLSGCRHTPSCSRYAIEAVERHGVVRGLGLAARRLLRCHPLGTSGFDPVPPVPRPR
jgi:uncharacterized protein